MEGDFKERKDGLMVKADEHHPREVSDMLYLRESFCGMLGQPLKLSFSQVVSDCALLYC